jgi:putative transposase
MSRQRRYHQDWNVYHVMIRCNNRQMLLRRKDIKIMLMGSFGKFQQRMGFKIYAFVIMDNHAHWLIQVQEKHGLSSVMQKVLLSFGRYYREHNHYVGHFWQGRYKSVSITTDKAMQEVLKYVHDNPLKVNMVNKSEGYIYSSVYKYLNSENELVDKLLTITRYGDISAGSCELIKT